MLTITGSCRSGASGALNIVTRFLSPRGMAARKGEETWRPDVQCCLTRVLPRRKGPAWPDWAAGMLAGPGRPRRHGSETSERRPTTQLRSRGPSRCPTDFEGVRAERASPPSHVVVRADRWYLVRRGRSPRHRPLATAGGGRRDGPVVQGSVRPRADPRPGRVG